jgi:hypothetical protein
MPESKVYILGAGCSKHCGYPLGQEMKDDLVDFGQSLDPATSSRLREAVRDTTALMGGRVDTIDTLVQKLYAGQLDGQIGAQNVDAWTRNGIRSRRVKAATSAISAAFLAKEKKVSELGFSRYRNFLYQLFPGAGSNWFAIQRSNCPHVLTFNYDRAFEIAFLDRFINTDQYLLYGQRVLNSGLNLNGIGFEPEEFSFLKLHGSVGMWAVDFPGDPIYQQRLPINGQTVTIDDRLFFPETPDSEHPSRSEREPLLFFPNQRQFIVSNESGFLFHKYAKAVWHRATELVSNATDIHVIHES